MLKVNKQVQFFPNQQGTGPLTWLTGTVTEILDCGHSAESTGETELIWSPFAMTAPHFKTIWWKKGKSSPENNFQDPKSTKVKSVSFLMDTSYMDARSMLFDEPDTHQTPPWSPPIITPAAILTQVAIIFTPCIYHQENHQLPTKRILHLQAGRDTSLNQPSSRPHDVDRGLTPRLSALLQEMSPLAPYKLERSTKAKARQAFSTMHYTPFDTPLR